MNTVDEIKKAALKELRGIFENPENQENPELGKAMCVRITSLIEAIEKLASRYIGGEEDYEEEVFFAYSLKDDICKQFHL